MGFEDMFDTHWMLRGELRYIDLGRASVSCRDVVAGSLCSVPGNTFHGEFSNTMMTGMVGVGYKF